MKAVRYFAYCLIFFSFSGFAQQEATTLDGKKILVYPDGTWKPAAPAESSTEIHPTSISHLELPKPRPQDQLINHAGYALSYNKTYHIANWVAYKLTAEETVTVVKRNNHFVPDPSLTCCLISNVDYKGSGSIIIPRRFNLNPLIYPLHN